jgi:hypothetical protein
MCRQGRETERINDPPPFNPKDTPPMTSTELTIHQFNNTDIAVRRADGYMDATAMCQANGKLIGHYLANATTKAFLDELSGVIVIPITELVQVTQGGDAGKQGTWVHPYIAVNLGQWCSPPFAVKVSQWVIDRNPGRTAVKLKPMSLTAIRLFMVNAAKLYGAKASAEMLREIGINVPDCAVFADDTKTKRAIGTSKERDNTSMILEFIRKDGGLTKSDLIRRTQWISKIDRDCILSSLIESGAVAVEISATKTKPIMVYTPSKRD